MERPTTKDVTESVEHKRRQSKKKLKRLGGLCSCCGSTEDDVEPEVAGSKVNDVLKPIKEVKGKEDSKLTTYPEVFTPPDEESGATRDADADPKATDARQYLGRNTTERQAKEIDPVKIAHEARAELERSSKTSKASRPPRGGNEDQDEELEQDKKAPDQGPDSEAVRQSIQDKSDKMRETLPRGSSASESGKLNSGRDSQPPMGSSKSRSSSDPKAGEQGEKKEVPKESPSEPLGSSSIAKKDTFMAVPAIEDEGKEKKK